MTKTCSQCGKEKNIEDFPFREKSKGTRRANCKECHSGKVKDRYYELKNITESFKTDGCVKCGEKRLYVLDFHHVDKESKDDTMARLATKYSEERLLKELEKCIVLCANCHREFHHLERESNVTLEEYLS